MIFKRACWTPSPDTSLVIEGFSDLRAILSISSIYTIPFWAKLISLSATLSKFSKIFSTSSPTYPASVKVVASAITKGTFSFLAKVLANKVFPHPVGPNNRILLFSNSTSSRSWSIFLFFPSILSL